MDGYQYVRDELDAHVGHLGGVADQLADAATSARGLGAPPPTSGVIGSFIPAMLQLMIDKSVDPASTGQRVVEDGAANVWATPLGTTLQGRRSLKI